MKARDVIELQQFKIQKLEQEQREELEEMRIILNDILAVVSPKIRLIGVLQPHNLRIILNDLSKEYHVEWMK